MAGNAPPFIVRPAAEADIEAAALWYELRSADLGSDFLRAVDGCFDLSLALDAISPFLAMESVTAVQSLIAEPDPGPPLYLSLCRFRN